MDLYLKAGPDGKSVGDCPFAHNVRMVLYLKVRSIFFFSIPLLLSCVDTIFIWHNVRTSGSVSDLLSRA